MTKKIFITGGFGYIGTFLAQEAVRKGFSVLLYDSLIYEQPYRLLFQKLSSGEKMEFVLGDVRNLSLLEQSLQTFQPDYVFHFGELSSVYACNHNPPYTEDINYIASKGVIDLCEKLNIPTFYNSSSSLYGQQKDRRLLTEEDSLPDPTDNYCKYKFLMEQYISEKVRKNPQYKIIIFRPATVCGVSPRMRIELLPNHFTYCAVAKGNIKISEAESFRAIIDIQELVNAYFRVLEVGHWNHLIYNIGHYNLSKIQVAKTIQSFIPCDIISLQNNAIVDLRNLQIDCSRFFQEFDFHPQKQFNQTIQELIIWTQNEYRVLEQNNFSGILNMSLDSWKKITS